MTHSDPQPTEPATAEASGAPRERVLRRRAQRLARVAAADAGGAVVARVAVVAVGGERFGIPAAGVREILPTPPITGLPGLPPCLVGLTQLRGELLAVVSLARWLELEPGEGGGCLVVVESPRGPVGLLVELSLGFLEVRESDRAEALSGTDGRGRRVALFTRDLCGVLDMEALLSDPRIAVAARRQAEGSG